MLTCPYCGAEVYPFDLSCFECGSIIAEDVEVLLDEEGDFNGGEDADFERDLDLDIFDDMEEEDFEDDMDY